MRWTSPRPAGDPDADLAAALPWLDLPPAPRWYPLVLGAAWALGFAGLALVEWGVVGTLLLVAAVLLGGVVTGAFQRHWTWWHDLFVAPREIRRVYRRYCLGFALALLAALVVFVLHRWAGVAAAFVLGAALTSWYEFAAYAPAVRCARARLGGTPTAP